MIRHLAEVLGGEDGVPELIEGILMNLLDGRDEVVQTNARPDAGMRYASTVG
jgi:hypothetical protein